MRLLDGFGDGPRVLAIGHDVTDLKDAQKRALQAERLAAIGEMVAGLAHESKNALNRCQVCMEMLYFELEDRPDAVKLLGRLQKAQDDVYRLFEDVRNYAAPVTLQLRRCNLAVVWREAWAQLETLRKGRVAALEECLGDVCLECSADPFRLEQVFLNILDNALAASPDPVEITIRCERATLDGVSAVRIVVRDRGCGLGLEERQRIFEPFYTTKTKGTGLGMAISKRIIEAHGGLVAVGESAGLGAEIILTLPRGIP
jgi:signal transduction histidine kinase